MPGDVEAFRCEIGLGVGADLPLGVWSESYGAQRFYGRHGFSKVGEYGLPVGNTVDHELILER